MGFTSNNTGILYNITSYPAGYIYYISLTYIYYRRRRRARVCKIVAQVVKVRFYVELNFRSKIFFFPVRSQQPRDMAGLKSFHIKRYHVISVLNGKNESKKFKFKSSTINKLYHICYQV